MVTAELPHSVFFSQKDFGPGTLTRTINGHKITEAKGVALKRGNIGDRVLHIQPDRGDSFSVVFQPSPEIDVIGFYPENRAKKHAARNGSYVEIGKPGILAQYDLKDGSMLMQEIDTKYLPHTALPLDMKIEDINLIHNLCKQLRNPRTPEPLGFVAIASLLETAFQTKEIIQEPPLFAFQSRLI